MEFWIDISALCSASADELLLCKAAPMLAAPSFSLHESMSAIELTDVKMDQCCGLDLQHVAYDDLFHVHLPQQLDADLLSNTLEAMLAQLVMFLNGGSVLDTTHQCVLLWAEGQRRIEHNTALPARALWLFAGGVTQAVRCVFECVLLADIFEDEDFSPNFRTSLAEWGYSSGETAALLRLLAAEVQDCDRLARLLQLAADLLDALALLQDFMKRSAASSSAAVRNGEVAAFPLPDLVVLRGVWIKLQAHLQAATPSAERGDCLPVFQSSLSKVSQAGPVRKVPEVAPVVAFASLSQLTVQLLQLMADLQQLAEDRALSFDQLLAWAQHMSGVARPHLLARSLALSCLQALAVDTDGLLERSMASRGLPSSITDNASCKEWLSGSPRQAAWELLKALTTCRSRMIARLDNALCMWGTVAAEALFMDDQLKQALDSGPQPWFTSWATLFVSSAMDLHLALTVEMGVLDPSELDYFYWYWDYVCSSHVHAADKLRVLRYELDVEMHNSSHSKDKGKKGKPPQVPQPRPPACEEMLLRGRGQLCKGLFRVCVLLKSLKVVPIPRFEFSLRSKAFERRFRSFQDIVNPGHLSYLNFLQTLSSNAEVNELQTEEDVFTNTSISSQVLLSSAVVCFQNARKCFDESKKLPGHNLWDALSAKAAASEAILLTKVSVAYSLQMTKLKHAGAETGQLEGAKFASINSSYHPLFPVLEVSNRLSV